MSVDANYAMDLLDELDADAKLSLTVPGEIRAAWLQAVQAINDRDGDYGSGRIYRWTITTWVGLTRPTPARR